MTTPLLYLDHAATSWPKSPRVIAAVAHALFDPGVAPDRGGGAQGRAAARAIAQARALVAQLLGVPTPERVTFTLNATDALNLAIKGALSPGDEVVTTTIEHNSVARPLARLERDHGVVVHRIAGDAFGVVAADRLLAAVNRRTRLVVLAHASNVTGALQPVTAVGAALRVHASDRRPWLLVDVAQSAGYRPLEDVAEVADLLAGAGHKGPGGPLGTGFLWTREGVELRPLREGGTGHRSEAPLQPEEFPGALEAGSPNVPGIVGLAVAIEERQSAGGVAAIAAARAEIGAEFAASIAAIDGIVSFGPPRMSAREPVFPMRIRGYSVAEAAALLESEFAITQRAGLHCNPGTHQVLGTAADGTLRFSFGHASGSGEVARAVGALRELARAAPDHR